MSHVMIDIETLGVSNNSVIATIAAIKFELNDVYSHLDEMQTFYKRIDINSCKSLKMKTSKDTLNWWSKQPENAKREIFSEQNRVSIRTALRELSDFCKGCTQFWSQGVCFDFPILENAFLKCKMSFPWKFWQIRDTRTIFSFCEVERKKQNLHHALHDCHDQINTLKKAYNKFFEIC